MFFYFPFMYYGHTATEYDESLSLLEMVGHLAKRVHMLEDGLQNAGSVINMLSSKIDALTLDVIYLNNSAETIIDIQHNKQYILKNNVTKLKLLAKSYIHDCNCENCTCNIKSKDGFICEISIPFSEGVEDIKSLIETDKFEIAWCNDTKVEEKTNATICIWWDGNRFCAALGSYNQEE